MSWTGALTRILTLSCADAAELASSELDEPLSRIEWLALAGHLLVCRPCRAFRHQLRSLRAVLRRGDESDTEQLSAEARRRIGEALRRAAEGRDDSPS